MIDSTPALPKQGPILEDVLLKYANLSKRPLFTLTLSPFFFSHEHISCTLIYSMYFPLKQVKPKHCKAWFIWFTIRLVPKLLCTALTGKCYATLKTNKVFHLLQNRFCKRRNGSYLNFSFSWVQTKLLKIQFPQIWCWHHPPRPPTWLRAATAPAFAAPAHSGTTAELCLMSINTGFSIPAKPPAWGCGTSSAPPSLAEIFCDGYSIHAASVGSSSSHCTAALAFTSQRQPRKNLDSKKPAHT